MGARGTGTWWCPSFVDEGQQAVAVDLPIDDESAGWWDYADAVVDAVGYRSDLVVVGHSLGGFTAPLVCARVPVDLVVLLAAMIPAPGELFSDWWTNTGYRAGTRTSSTTTSLQSSLPRRAGENGTRIPGRCASRGRCRRGRRSGRSICCAVRTACSPPSGHVASAASGSGSSPTRLTAATTSR